MSLLGTKTWWSTKLNGPTEEEYHHGSMCIANVDNEPKGEGTMNWLSIEREITCSIVGKIVVGTFQGLLRIYAPVRRDSFLPADLRLEQQLGGPILQVVAGRILSYVHCAREFSRLILRFRGSSNIGIAVLHPRKVSVYTVQTSQEATICTLERRYEHRLEHTAFNMLVGPFGGVQGESPSVILCNNILPGKDFLCVQSMDGVISFFERESATYSRLLPNFLLPGPLSYIPKIDCFITSNAQLDIECFRCA